MEERYRLIGGPGSPYSLKIRALMRYRRLPFDWLIRARVGGEVAHVKPPTIPILHTPSDGFYQSDSTPIVEYLEQRHPEQRSVIPDDPGRAFLNFMLEDMSDEWATKFMYQQRWHDAVDHSHGRQCSQVVERSQASRSLATLYSCSSYPAPSPVDDCEVPHDRTCRQ